MIAELSFSDCVLVYTEVVTQDNSLGTFVMPTAEFLYLKLCRKLCWRH